MNQQPQQVQIPETLSIPTKVLDPIMQYLGSRPYAEVAQLISSVHEVTTPQVQQYNQNLQASTDVASEVVDAVPAGYVNGTGASAATVN